MDNLRFKEAGCYICLLPCGIKASIIFDGQISSVFIIRPWRQKVAKYCSDFISGNELSCSSCPESQGKNIEILEVIPLL